MTHEAIPQLPCQDFLFAFVWFVLQDFFLGGRVIFKFCYGGEVARKEQKLGLGR